MVSTRVNGLRQDIKRCAPVGMTRSEIKEKRSFQSLRAFQGHHDLAHRASSLDRTCMHIVLLMKFFNFALDARSEDEPGYKNSYGKTT